MDATSLTAELKSAAAQLGFARSGACPAVGPEGLARFDQWLAAGYAGEMRYLPDRRAAYEHPRHVLDGVRSVLVLAFDYRTVEPSASQPGQGRVSRYAWGSDYHDLIHDRLRTLREHFLALAPAAHVRGVIDTAPLLERDLAQLAGLGWIGKNTLLLSIEAGSYFFLAALLTDLELDYDAAHDADHCGTCRACLDACPTDAFVAPYVLDARRCISYLTIESRQSIPHELREGMGDWLFGCDVCQDVCPWNRHAPIVDEPTLQPSGGETTLELVSLFEFDDESFRRRFRNTPLWRPKRRGILRNAAIVLGNRPTPLAVEALIRGLNDSESLVRGACAWALGRQEGDRTRDALEQRLAQETDDAVREELLAALAGAG